MNKDADLFLAPVKSEWIASLAFLSTSNKKSGFPILNPLPRKPIQLAAAKPVRVNLEPVYRKKQTTVLPPAESQVNWPSPHPSQRLEIAAWQVALERRHFSCGTIEGEWGMRSRRAASHFQKSRGLKVTGQLDESTKLHLGKPETLFVSYSVKEEDLKQIAPTPATWKGKAAVTYLGYNDGWEMVAEKFHTTPQFLRLLNPGRTTIEEGTTLAVPDVISNVEPLPKIGAIHILLSETTMLLYDQQNHLIGCFPCSIAADKRKRPDGALQIIAIAAPPNYTFNPSLFPDVAAKEGITHKLLIPPGPNNPVGLAWIGLSLPGYGIHGTPDPSAISRTGSKGCFRLANWNVNQLVGRVHKGTPVIVEE